MIWFDGQLVGEAQMDATSAGILTGWGVFTTVAIRDSAPVFWEHHAARLERDAAAARVELSFSTAQLRAGLDELLAQLEILNGLARLTGTRRGDGRWNAQSGAHWSIVAQSAPPSVPPSAATAPLRLEVSPFRVAARAPLAGVKTTSYLPYFIAWEEARAHDFDEALLLTETGWVCESARASIFWAKNGELYTPSLGCGCLRGVGRAIVIENFAVRQGQFSLQNLWEADECFLVSGASGVRPILSLYDAGKTRDFGKMGPRTRDVAAWFQSALPSFS